jgi:hypothetical protein
MLTIVVEGFRGERFSQTDDVRMPHPPPVIDRLERGLADKFEPWENKRLSAFHISQALHSLQLFLLSQSASA